MWDTHTLLVCESPFDDRQHGPSRRSVSSLRRAAVEEGSMRQTAEVPPERRVS